MSATNAAERKENRKLMMKKKRQRRKVARNITFVICMLVAVLSLANLISDDTYKSEEEFTEHVQGWFDDIESHRSHAIGNEAEIRKYDENRSVALRYPQTGVYATDAYIEDVISSVEEGFYSTYEEIGPGDKVLRLMDYDTHETPKSAFSVVLIQEDQQKKKGEMRTVSQKVRTYNFSSKTGAIIEGIQIFNVNYKQAFSEYLTEYLEKKYGRKLNEDYEKYLEPRDSRLNTYALTETGVMVYFQPGTVLPEDEGVICVEIRYVELDDVIRDDIVIRAIDPDKPMVALTYDDGPYPKTSNRILDCLEKNGVVATFFEVGKNAEAYPEVIERKAQMGMEIGNHTWSHPNLFDLKKSSIESQIDRTSDVIDEICGQRPTLFRPPYGNTNSKVEKIADMPVILWSVDTKDWDSRNADKIMKIVKKIEKNDGLDGRVILMHSIYSSTAEATEEMVPWLKEKGYQLVTVSEMIEYKYGEKPKDGKLYGYGYFYLDD